jgi:hypothetical protein
LKCLEAREAVLGGQAPSTPALKEHLEACADCSTIAALYWQAPLPSREAAGCALGAELEPLRRRLESTLARERAWPARLRGLPTRWRILLAAVTAASMSIALGVLSPRVDLEVYPLARMLGSALVFAVVLAALLLRGLRPLQAPDRTSQALRWALVGLALPFAIALPEVHLARPVPFHDAHDCLLIGTVAGAVLMAVLAALDRKPAATRSLLVAASAGGILANLALSFHCPVTSPLHLVVIHAPIGLVLLCGYRGVRFARRHIARAATGG